MSATQHTTNLHLSQFQATDIPTWMTDYNGDMMRIDNSIGNISDLVNPEGSLVDNINAFQDDVDALETLIGSATDLPVPTDTVTKNILQINNNLSPLITAPSGYKTDGLLLHDNLEIIRGGYMIIGNIVHVSMRIRATAAVTINGSNDYSSIIVGNLPKGISVQNGAGYGSQIVPIANTNKNFVCDFLPYYNEQGNAKNANFKVANGSALTLTSNEGFIINGIYPLA